MRGIAGTACGAPSKGLGVQGGRRPLRCVQRSAHTITEGSNGQAATNACVDVGISQNAKVTVLSTCRATTIGSRSLNVQDGCIWRITWTTALITATAFTWKLIASPCGISCSTSSNSLRSAMSGSPIRGVRETSGAKRRSRGVTKVLPRLPEQVRLGAR